jgi:hypothetical protein
MATLRIAGMSHGHGKIERFILATLTERGELTAQAIAASHPDHRHSLPSRSFMSSLNRALRKLHEAGTIERAEHAGSFGWTLCDKLSDREVTAFHEAGHAVIGSILSLPVRSATIKPTDAYLGAVQFGRLKPDELSRVVCRNHLIAIFAGPAAEPKQGITRRTARGSDASDIKTLVAQLVGTQATDGRLVYFRPDHRAERKELRRQAEKLVLKHSDAIARVARALIDCETLTGKEIDEIIAG